MRVGAIVVPTYDELFKATGGKRLGAFFRLGSKQRTRRRPLPLGTPWKIN
jgi:hypothetical protein